MGRVIDREPLGQGLRACIARPLTGEVALVFDHGGLILSEAEADQIEAALAAMRQTRARPSLPAPRMESENVH